MPNATPKLYRGSEWRKWDLHVHSPASYGFTGSWKQLEEQLKKADCAVVGINDYFSVAGYMTIKEKIDKGDLDLGQVKILPVVEFRMRDVLKNKHTGRSGQNINFHVIFSDSILVQKIETFLKSLEVNGTQIADKYDNPQFLKEVAKVYFEKDVINKLKNNNDFSGKFIVWLPYDEYGGIDDIDPETDDWIKGDFIKKSHVLGSSNKNQTDFFLWKSPLNEEGKEKFTTNQFREWFGVKKPCIKGSDSHNYSYPIGKLKDQNSKPSDRFCWIKADPTFEGLKQIIYEPEDRVRIQELKPEGKSDYNIIDRVEYINFSGAVKQVVYFNQNLNSIIGSRATGKSNLLRNIAFSIDPEQCRGKDVELKDFLQLKDFKVFWKDKKENTLELQEEKEKGILFIPQKYLGELVYERSVQFDEFLSSLFENKEDFRQTLQNYRKFENENILQITLLIRELLAIREDGREKEGKIKKLGKREDVESEIRKIDLKLKEINKGGKKITNKELEAYKRFSAERTKQEYHIKILDKDITSLELLKEEEVITAEKIFEFEFSQKYREKIEKKLKESDELFKKEFIELEINNLKKDRAKLEKAISEIEISLKPLREKVEKHQSLIELTKALQDKKDALQSIIALKKELDELRKAYNDKLGAIVVKYLLFNEQYKSLSIDIGALEFSSVEITTSFDEKLFKSFIGENINYHNSTSFRNDEKKIYEVANKFLRDPEQWNYNKNQFSILLKQLLLGILSGNLLLKSGKDEESVLIELLKNRYKIDFIKSIKNKKGEEFDVMTDGEKALALLEFIFKFDDYNYPVLIDQPEDDLDARAISKHIVDFIKEEKIKRQIIIASHNANLVVCGDSEEVVVSNKSGARNPNFKYPSGAIENPIIRGEIIEVLEGGEEALAKRRDKLNLRS